VEKSRADIAAADARTSEYEQRLREARATVFRAQEARRKAALDARAAAMAEARSKAQTQVKAAKADIEKDREAAQGGLQLRCRRWRKKSCDACWSQPEQDVNGFEDEFR